MSVSCPGDWPDTVLMSKARARGKRYETALRVGSLANLALVSARSPRAVEEARSQAPAAGPVRVADGQGGQWSWSNSWRVGSRPRVRGSGGGRAPVSASP